MSVLRGLFLEGIRGMSMWTIVIYVAAAVLAVQGLLALMTAHRRRMVRQMLEEELARKENAVRTPDAKSPQSDASPGGRRPQAV
jgi:hypothetical protein